MNIEDSYAGSNHGREKLNHWEKYSKIIKGVFLLRAMELKAKYKAIIFLRNKNKLLAVYLPIAFTYYFIKGIYILLNKKLFNYISRI